MTATCVETSSPEVRCVRRLARSAASVMDMPVYSRRSADTRSGSQLPMPRRFPSVKVSTLSKIPVMPISYQDAEPFLKNLGGRCGSRELARESAADVSRGTGSGQSASAFEVQLGSQAAV